MLKLAVGLGLLYGAMVSGAAYLVWNAAGLL